MTLTELKYIVAVARERHFGIRETGARVDLARAAFHVIAADLRRGRHARRDNRQTREQHP